MSLSDLPESVLLHIISFLPVKDAINTSLLAKPWRNLWTLTPFLYFDQRLFDSPMAITSADNRRLFAKFVDRALILYNAPRLLSLAICFDYLDFSYCSHVDSWIRFAALRGVQQIELNLRVSRTVSQSPEEHFMPYEVPVFALAAAPFLRALKLVSCLFNRPPSGFFLLSLESLSLKLTQLTDVTVPDIIAGCPRLETLVIKRCWGITHLKVVSQRLKNLSIGYVVCTNGSMEISVPSLLSFRCVNYHVGSYSIKDVDSLVYAEIEFLGMPKYRYWWRKMIDAMSHVRALTCQNFWFQDPRVNVDVSKKTLLNNLKYLDTVTLSTKLELLGLVILLRSAPNLETLVLRFLQPIPLGNNDDNSSSSNNSSDESNLDEILDEMLIGPLPHLKKIKIKSFTGMESELFVLKFLLKCGMVLEKMTLLPDKDGFNYVPAELLAERFKELPSFPRSSPDAQIVLV